MDKNGLMFRWMGLIAISVMQSSLVIAEEVVDIKDVHPTRAGTPTVVVMQANAAQSVKDSSHIFGVCSLVRLDAEGEGHTIVAPIGAANSYFAVQKLDPRVTHDANGWDMEGVTVQVIQPPQHGKLMTIRNGGVTSDITEAVDWISTEYYPDKDYQGNDSLILQVEGNGHTVQMHYFFRIGSEGDTSSISDNPACKNVRWIISSSGSDFGNINNLFLLNGIPFNGYQLKQVDISLNFANLTNGAVGETIGHSITLDDDGNGYGWFIDSTPESNDEFLPTSNPNEWIAKPGSEAAGKMDLLTVLLHEYGHALGLDHSADTHDFMAEELQPGVRRTVSDADMAKLWSLLSEPVVADASTGSATGMGTGSDPSAPFVPLSSLGLSFMFGFARRRIDTSPAGQGIVLPPLTGGDPNAVTINQNNVGLKPDLHQTPQHELATHSGVFNSDFSVADTTNSQYGWSTRGNVSMSSGAAEILESDRTLSGFSQAFVLPAGVDSLRFTIEAAQFTANGAAPPDAFEVALLNSVTGLPAAGTVSLTHSDGGHQRCPPFWSERIRGDGRRSFRMWTSQMSTQPALSR